MGTNLADEEILFRQFQTAAATAARLRIALGGLTEVDLGGGFGLSYAREGGRPRFHTLAGRLCGLLDEDLPGWRDGHPRIAFESGRYLVGDCGVLICRVVDVKSSKGQVFAVLDAGVNHLGGMAGLRRLPPIVPTVQPFSSGHDASSLVPTAVVGPLCTPLDMFVRDAELPPLAVGQLVSIPNVGAYGLTASLLAFLGHLAPVEVVVDDDQVVSASRLELTRAETAAWLQPVPSPIALEGSP
jgi:diaminopimelate decarboxylase